MSETFFILLAGGIMLSAGISDPKQVTLPWLRLAGIIALAMAGLGLFFYFSRDAQSSLSPLLHGVQVGLLLASAVAILAQLGFVQNAWRRTQRAFAVAAFILAVLAGVNLLHELMTSQQTAVRFPPKGLSIALQALACAGAGAMCGLVLMDMLLGHAYLTASRMTVSPFKRLNRALALTLAGRMLLAVAVAMLLQRWRPLEMLWGVHGLLILTRWLVGLALPALFVYMAHDCIRRRATQSATGILYVAGVLVFIGELIALQLVRSTGLPF